MFWFLLPLPVHGVQAYTSQIAVLTMIALAVGEDSISSRERRERIIDGLIALPGRSCWCRVPCARIRLPVVEACAVHHERLCFSGGLIGLPGRCCWCHFPRSFGEAPQTSFLDTRFLVFSLLFKEPVYIGLPSFRAMKSMG